MKKALYGSAVSFALAALVVPVTAARADDAFLKAAAAPYAGTSIRILDETTPLQEAVRKVLPEFEEISGIKVEWELLSHPDVISKGQADMLSGRGYYDGVMLHSYQFAPMVDAGVLLPFDDFRADASLSDPGFAEADMIQAPYTSTAYTAGKQYSFINWNYNQVYWARADLFADAGEQAAFKARYDYDLGPAKTIEAMRDIAEFFTRKKGETLAGEVLDADFYGIVLEGIKGGSTFPTLWTSFIKNYGGDLIDAEGRPNFDTPETVAALKMWAELWTFAPPGIAEYSLVDVPTVMGNGIAAQTLAWSDFVLGVDQPGAAPYAGKFVYAGVPAKEGREDQRFADADPSAIVISAASKNPQATFLFLQWLSSPETQAKLLEAGNGGVPIRTGSWDLDILKNNPNPTLFKAMESTLDVATAKPRMPQFFEIFDAMSGVAQEVGLGTITPEEGARKGQELLLGICETCLL